MWDTIVSILTVIGSLGIFIYGMKVMSEGIQKAAGNSLRKILSAMTKNRVFGVLTGFLITGLIQSSSATTVMTVSFVNAGLLSLVESAGVMMGANVGTTITGWLVSYLGFKFKIIHIAVPIVAFGLPMLFFKKDSIRSWGEFIIGFAILFIGLDFLKNAVPNLKDSPEVLAFLQSWADPNLFSRLVFVGIGALLTIVIQSSSAAMALTFVMTAQGWIPFDVAAAMILGENIGTTITAEIASMIGNVHAKRSARIHSMFNIVGVTWMVLMLPLILPGITWFSENVMHNVPHDQNNESIALELAYFHTFFNTMNVLLLIGFVPLLVKLAIRTVPSRTDDDEEFHLEYIGTGLMGTPELSMMEARKEIARMGEITAKMNGFVSQLLIETDEKRRKKLYKKLKKYEEITDRVEVEVSDYLVKVSQGELSEILSDKIRCMLSNANDLESIGDIYYQMARAMERKQDEKIWFSPIQRESLQEMAGMLDHALAVMIKNLVAPERIDLDAAGEAENQINKHRSVLRKQHLKSVEKGDYNIKSGLVYSNLFGAFERVGDHAMSISAALSGEV